MEGPPTTAASSVVPPPIQLEYGLRPHHRRRSSRGSNVAGGGGSDGSGVAVIARSAMSHGVQLSLNLMHSLVIGPATFCQICREDCTMWESYRLSCGHAFCRGGSGVCGPWLDARM